MGAHLGARWDLDYIVPQCMVYIEHLPAGSGGVLCPTGTFAPVQGLLLPRQYLKHHPGGR